MRRFLPIVFAIAFTSYGQQVLPADTFGVAGLSEAARRQVLQAIRELAYDTPDSWAEELKLKKIDLGGSSGLVVQGTKLLCGATGNCQLFVFRNVHGKWVSLFDRDAPLADSYVFGPDSTNGIKDLTTTVNTSAEQVTRTVYKFDGRSYRPH
jgi:hypothetical protein